MEENTTVERIQNGKVKILEIKTKELVIGDIVILKQSKVEVDMIIIEGKCIVDESNLTGESNNILKY